jgi:hypothetical protein
VTWNEVLAFHLDCLLGLGKTPTTLGMDIHLSREQVLLLSKQTLSMMRERGWKGDGDENGEEHSNGSVVLSGVAQIWIDGVRKRPTGISEFERYFQSLCTYMESIGVLSLCGTPFSLAILNQRLFFDFIQGNWDRPNNHFFFQEERLGEEEEGADSENVRGTGFSRSLVYIDHNHVHQFKTMTFDLTEDVLTCRHFFKDYELLVPYANHPERIISEMLLSLEQDPIFLRETSNYYRGKSDTIVPASIPSWKFRPYNHSPYESPLQTGSQFLDVFLGKYGTRIALFVDHIQDCIAKYGTEFVFLEKIN